MASYAAPSSNERRWMPPEVNNLLTAWWLTLAFAGLLILMLTPDLPFGLASLGNFLWFAVGAGIVALGGYVGWGIAQGWPSALRICKLALLIGLIAGLIGTIGFFVLKSQESPAAVAGAPPPAGAMGASITLSMALMAFAILPPFLFAMLGLSLSQGDAIQQYFFPPPPEEVTVKTEPLAVDEQAVAAALAGDDFVGAALAAARGDDDENIHAAMQVAEAVEADGAEAEVIQDVVEVAEAIDDASAPLVAEDAPLPVSETDIALAEAELETKAKQAAAAQKPEKAKAEEKKEVPKDVFKDEDAPLAVDEDLEI